MFWSRRVEFIGVERARNTVIRDRGTNAPSTARDLEGLALAAEKLGIKVKSLKLELLSIIGVPWQQTSRYRRNRSSDHNPHKRWPGLEDPVHPEVLSMTFSVN